MTEKFLRTVSDFSKKRHLFPENGGTVIAAVSGGCDSMCLLNVLHILSAEFCFTLVCAHYNHRLRGAESDRDEAFVKKQCEKLSVECYTGFGDVYGESVRQKKGIEETARDMRYSFFAEIAKKYPDCRIATAHSADDNAETVILNLVRGAGSAGLSGIPPQRDNIIRPLLCVQRDDIERFLAENGIPHVEDSTNSSDAYTRNKIRHNVIPVLKGISPGFASDVFRACRLLEEDELALLQIADNFILENYSDGKLSCKELAALPYAVSGRVIRKLIPRLSKTHVDSVLNLCKSGSPSGMVMLPGKKICRQYDDLIINGGVECGVSFSPFILSEEKSFTIMEAGLKVFCEKCINTENIHNSFNYFSLKYDTIHGAVTVRPRASGDFIAQSGRNCTKTLKKLYMEKRVPVAKRNLIPVFADEKGVIAVYGFGISERNKASFGDTVLNIRIEEII